MLIILDSDDRKYVEGRISKTVCIITGEFPLGMLEIENRSND